MTATTVLLETGKRIDTAPAFISLAVRIALGQEADRPDGEQRQPAPCQRSIFVSLSTYVSKPKRCRLNGSVSAPRIALHSPYRLWQIWCPFDHPLADAFADALDILLAVARKDRRRKAVVSWPCFGTF